VNDTQSPKFKKEFRIKGSEKILNLIKDFSATEKVVFTLFTVIAITSALVMSLRVNKAFLVPIPSHGGAITEGIVGLPRSINPVLAFTDVDRDISTLIYSGLMKYENGKLVGDLAKKYTISDDGLTYTFTLKDNIRFHDGMPLTTDDIEFTIQKVEDGILKSPRRADWANVTVKKIDQNQIQFILKQPYSPFLANTTIGILPKHIWKNVDADQFIFSQYNIEPIGSGPYKLSNIKRDSGGIPEIYNLESFNKYYDGEAYISTLSINFFPNEKAAIDAYVSGNIESIAGISPIEVTRIASSTTNIKILDTTLPRIFGIFFNQNNSPVLANKEVRLALDTALDKDRIIKEVLYGYGVSIDSPLPLGTTNTDEKTEKIIKPDKELAKNILGKAGWTLNANGIFEKKDKKSTQTLSFSISTADTPVLKLAAEIAKSEWRSIGIDVNVKVFEYGDLSQNIIKTRKYDALLFGEFVGKDLDLYAFWHSSQRNSPGLNVSMYVNSKADKLLEEARTTSDEETKSNKYQAFEKIIKDEIPAVFLYSPEYIYIVPDKIKGMTLGAITNSSDRWYGINKWYITTDDVWEIFTRDDTKQN
jgi:peptide/nickel transport system substrate-binding protein